MPDEFTAYQDFGGADLLVEKLNDDAVAATFRSVNPVKVAVAPGQSFTFEATTSGHYTVQEWLLDNTIVQTGGGSFKLVNITADHQVSVTFYVPDRDSDGMPDSYEIQYGGSATGFLPGADADGDGMTNLAEFLAAACFAKAFGMVFLGEPREAELAAAGHDVHGVRARAQVDRVVQPRVRPVHLGPGMRDHTPALRRSVEREGERRIGVRGPDEDAVLQVVPELQIRPARACSMMAGKSRQARWAN